MNNIEEVRTFSFKLKDGTGIRLVEKENYDKLVKRIKELEKETTTLKKFHIIYIQWKHRKRIYTSSKSKRLLNPNTRRI